MNKTTVDPCMIVRRDINHNLQGLIVLQVDGILEQANEQLLLQEQHESKYFKTKPRNLLEDAPLFFNCIWISKIK